MEGQILWPNLQKKSNGVKFLHGPFKVYWRVVPAWESILTKPLDHYLFICTQVYVKARQEETQNFLL